MSSSSHVFTRHYVLDRRGDYKGLKRRHTINNLIFKIFYFNEFNVLSLGRIYHYDKLLRTPEFPLDFKFFLLGTTTGVGEESHP